MRMSASSETLFTTIMTRMMYRPLPQPKTTNSHNGSDHSTRLRAMARSASQRSQGHALALRESLDMCVVAAMGEHDQLVIRLRRDAAEAVAEAEDARAAMQKNERQRSHDAAMQRAREADLQMQARGACQPASQLRRAPSGPARLGGGASRGARRALRGTQGVLSDPGSSADAAAASASSTCGNFHTAAPPAECRPARVCLYVCMFVCLCICFLPQTQQLTEQLASKESAIRKLTESAGAKEDRVRRPAAPPASALAGDWVRLATTSAPGLGSPRCRICAGTGSPRRPI